MSGIKVITEPSVYLVGRQEVDDAELARFLSDEGVERWSTDTEVAGEKLIEVAGRVCYMSFAKPRPGGNSAYIGHLLDVGHGSCVEHSVFNLIVTGVSRSFSHELVRHRAGFGYSQLSQRFVDEGGTADRPLDIVEPPLIAECRRVADAYCREHGVDRGLVARCHIKAPGTIWAACAAVEDWDNFVPEAARAYGALDAHATAYLEFKAGLAHYGPGWGKDTARRKMAREAARSVLPNATETKVFVTANGRALRHFLEMRGDVAADAEMRRVAVAMLGVLKAESPNLFGDIESYTAADGFPAVRAGHHKV